MSTPVPGGVGLDNDIVAYSILCAPIRAAPRSTTPRTVASSTPAYFIFDAETGGQMFCGQAPTRLPQIVLESDPKTNTIAAVEVNGLINGGQANVLEGETDIMVNDRIVLLPVTA